MAKRDYSEEVITSPKAYEITSYIARNVVASPTDIARDLDSSINTITNYISGLKERDFIELAKKDGRSKYYSVNYEEIGWFAHSYWLKKRENMEQELSEEQKEGVLRDVDKEISKELEFEQNEDWEDSLEINTKFPKYCMHFSEHYLKNVRESTIQKMVHEDLVHSVIRLIYSVENVRDIDFPEWLEQVNLFLIPAFMNLSTAGDSITAGFHAFEEMKNEGT